MSTTNFPHPLHEVRMRTLSTVLGIKTKGVDCVKYPDPMYLTRGVGAEHETLVYCKVDKLQGLILQTYWLSFVITGGCNTLV